MNYKGYVIATAIKPESREPCAWVYRPQDWRAGKMPLFETTSVEHARAWIDDAQKVDVLNRIERL